MNLELTGCRALVTGGSRGIGKAVARLLAQEGCDVALLARDAVRLAASAAELRSVSGRQVIGVTADTRDDTAVDAAVAAAREQLGGDFTILVNAAAHPAGHSVPPPVERIDNATFHEELDTKVMGYLRTARAVIPGMKAAGWGRIVLVSGLAARQTGNALGSMRNVAVAALGKNMADELGPSGIQVNVVHPGLTHTERTDDLVAARASARGVDPSVVRAELDGLNSIRRLVTAEEVAQLVVFLCSPKASALNGEIIAAGGGAPRSIHY